MGRAAATRSGATAQGTRATPATGSASSSGKQSRGRHDWRACARRGLQWTAPTRPLRRRTRGRSSGINRSEQGTPRTRKGEPARTEAGGSPRTGPPSREQWRPGTRTTTARQAPDGRDAAPQAARTAGRTEQRGKAERTPTTRGTTRTRTAGKGTPHRKRRPGAKAGGRRDGNRQGAVRSANQVARGPPATSGPRAPTAPSGGPHLDRKGTQEGKVAITRQCESGPAAEERATGPAEATGPGRSAE